MTIPQRLACVLAALSLLIPARAGVRQDPAEDPEERAERLELGRRTFTENCLICHGPEMIVQQRLTPGQWKAEVDKMISWGSPVPEAERGRLMDYLNTTFSPTAPPASPIPVSRPVATARFQVEPPPAPDPAQVERGGPLFQKHCATCHGAEARGGDLGQNLVLNRALLDIPGCQTVIRDGRNRMPGFAMVIGDRDAADILAWLRTRPNEPPR